MARLGGEFAMLFLVSVPPGKLEDLMQDVSALREEGYAVTTRETGEGDPAKFAGWMPYRIEVSGADHEGIIHHITQPASGGPQHQHRNHGHGNGQSPHERNPAFCDDSRCACTSRIHSPWIAGRLKCR